LPPLPKKRLTFWNKEYLAAAVLAALIGTYLDLYFVGKGLYEFPTRLMPKIFPINIAFTLFGLPILTIIFLNLLSQVNKWGKLGLILFASLLMSIFEKLAERFGLFIHSEHWQHLYTFFGYLMFLTIVSRFYFWMKKRSV